MDPHKAFERPVSNRSFGYSVGIVFVLMAAFLLQEINGLQLIFLFVGSALIFSAWLFPEKLELFKQQWVKLGSVMGGLVNPLIMGALYMILIVPCSLVFRLKKRDFLLIQKGKRETMWKTPSVSSSVAANLKNQF
ncbi:SxtJ family membrane protein [Candidatus Ponderosibacter sp. Uisw_141_02]|uniref:SxtJ family membrane protein n=1 Tax=Candidatus Ponderosibacter sp. Uisw_141_02 TaxID=3231000 RepID=UPI003D57759D